MVEQLDISLVERQRCMTEFCVQLGKNGSENLQFIHQANGVQISHHVISGLYQSWKGSSEARKPPVRLSSWSLWAAHFWEVGGAM
jgi:hypothetical protein